MTDDVTEAEFDAMVKATGHTCPPWCHRCPLMPNNGVMPRCMGSVLATDERDLGRCCCPRPKRDTAGGRVASLEARVAELERRLEGGQVVVTAAKERP